MGSIPTRSRHPGRFVACGLAFAVLLPPSGGPGAVGARTRSSRASATTGSVVTDTVPPTAPDTARPAGVDTTGAPGGPDTTRPDSAAAGGRPGPAPLAALARSIILPGWGQAAVGRPVRGAFYFAAEAGSLFMVVKSQQKLDAARRAVGAGQADSSLVRSRVSQREDWIVLSAFWALMSGVDAWVSANLSDFQQPLTPPPDGTPGAALQVRIPLGGGR